MLGLAADLLVEMVGCSVLGFAADLLVKVIEVGWFADSLNSFIRAQPRMK